MGNENKKIDEALTRKANYERHATLSRSWNRFWLLALAILLVVIAVWYFNPREPDWKVSGTGMLNYTYARGSVLINEQALADDSGDKLFKLQFSSRDSQVYALLRAPKGEGNMPGIVLLPGAEVTKEDEQKVARELADMGYVTLTIDQRGIGESKEEVGDLSSNYEFYRQAQEPPIHKMVYDALRAYDVLRERPEVDAKKIAFMGESMGGRTAIIAAALEPGVKGVVGISTGGYGMGDLVPKNNQTLFQKSMDPDAYVGMISPRKVLLLHSAKDNVVLIDNGERTIGFANEPKRFLNFSCETHGYCPEMKEGLSEGLIWIFEG